MVLVLGSVIAKEGCYDEVLALSEAHVRRSRAEPGCLSHAVHRDTENPQRLVFVEEWSDREALTAHFRLPASRAFVQSLAQFAAAPPAISVYDATQITHLVGLSHSP